MQCRACLDAGVTDVPSLQGSIYCGAHIHMSPVDDSDTRMLAVGKREAPVAISPLRDEVSNDASSRRSALRKSLFVSGSDDVGGIAAVSNATASTAAAESISMGGIESLMRRLLREERGEIQNMIDQSIQSEVSPLRTEMSGLREEINENKTHQLAVNESIDSRIQ